MQSDALYLGFASHGNLGDDVIRDVLADALPGIHFVPVAVRKRALMNDLLAASAVRRRRLPLLLGGGTVLGRRLWRGHIARTRAVYSPSSWSMLGAGVEDPAFQGDANYTSEKELRRWPEILSKFAEVTVRGPRSKEILSGLGIEATVVGDPALLMTTQTHTDSVRDIDLLVNATCGEDQWGGTKLDWSATLGRALSRVQGSGARVAFVAMEATDIEWNRRVEAHLTRSCQHFFPESTEALQRLLLQAWTVIGTRLHVNVVAAALGIPSISLEYRPKCRDFMRSINQERFCFRVDALEVEQLCDAMGMIAVDWTVLSSEVSATVSALRVELKSRIPRILDDLAT